MFAICNVEALTQNNCWGKVRLERVGRLDHAFDAVTDHLW